MSAELNELAEGLIQSQIDWWERKGAAMKSSKDVLAFACVIGATAALDDLRNLLRSKAASQ